MHGQAKDQAKASWRTHGGRQACDVPPGDRIVTASLDDRRERGVGGVRDAKTVDKAPPLVLVSIGCPLLYRVVVQWITLSRVVHAA
jgi:hypothetical protein